MRVVVQRVTQAAVHVGDEEVSRIGPGLLVVAGVGHEDTEQDARFMAGKIAGLRIFEDRHGKMNLSALQVGGSVLVVSQFTLYGDCRKGRRPSFIAAAPPEQAERMYDQFVEHVGCQGISVATGRFRAHMQVELTNDGPVTIWIDTEE